MLIPWLMVGEVIIVVSGDLGVDVCFFGGWDAIPFLCVMYYDLILYWLMMLVYIL